MTAPDRGAEMLAALDAKLAAGELTQHEYDAQRVRVLELIRRGRVDLAGTRRVVVITCSLLLLLMAVGALAALRTPGGVVLAVALAVAGVIGLRRAV